MKYNTEHTSNERPLTEYNDCIYPTLSDFFSISTVYKIMDEN